MKTVLYLCVTACVVASISAIIFALKLPVVLSPLDGTPYGVDHAEGPVQQDSITLLFVGDVMLGRHVETLANAQGWGSRFTEVAPVFEGYDAVIANLEGPVPVVHQKTPDFSTTFSFTPKAVQALADSGVDYVSLANNHTHDFGADAYQNTVTVVSESGIKPFGHPRAPSEPIAEFDFGQRKVVFIGLNDVFGILDIEAANALIEQYNQDDTTVIVSIHWGDEYQTTSNARQQELARGFITSGADAIVGHHPHVRQEWADVEGVPVFYSLGNFLFDQYFSAEVQKGYAVEMQITKDGAISYKVLDVVSEASIPRIVEEQVQ